MKDTWRRREAEQAMVDRLSSPRDGESDADTIGQAAHDAVEVATSVKITPDIIAAASATGRGFGFDLSQALKAAFEAAGFEVVE